MKWNKNGGDVLLCCFGSFPKIEDRLKRFIESKENVQTSLCDPYSLYVIILDELHALIDNIVWDLIYVFNHTETVRFLGHTLLWSN